VNYIRVIFFIIKAKFKRIIYLQRVARFSVDGVSKMSDRHLAKGNVNNSRNFLFTIVSFDLLYRPL